MKTRIFLIGILLASTIASARADGDSPGANSRNLHSSYPEPAPITRGVSWPQGQALPRFAPPAATLDTVLVQSLSPDEQITFSALQGRVNRERPRIYLLDSRADEGTYTWADTSTVNFTSRTTYTRETKFDLVAKYANELDGVVLYDPSKSPHYRNLAGTIASLRNAVPVTREVYQEITDHGARLDIVADVTRLPFTSAIDIYNHLYDTYWEHCDHRLIVSAKPDHDNGAGDFHHTRDLAAATGAAVVWLNTLDPQEKAVLQKFFADMTPGEAVVMGWYTTERSGITTASAFGIGTLPADHYISGSVYAGTDPTIQIPAVPVKPDLENKIYVSIFISDGDNIQYTQRAMRKIWDAAAPARGRIPLNWTMAPGLVDIGPALLNYYYTTATPNDCFVTGPSGMGYLMPFNTLTEPGAPVGNYLTEPWRMDGYAQLTETYLQRSGLRVITIWDDATPMQRASYERHGRNLYGATVQNFRDVPAVAGSTENNRVRFDRLVIPYTGTYDHIHRSLTEQINRWTGESPLFLAYQVDIWGEMKPARIVDLHQALQKEHPGKFEFVRADHYFNLANEAHGLPFNLAMSPQTTVTASDTTTRPELAMDGTPTTVWESSGSAEPWLKFDFGASHRLSRYVIRHADEAGPGKFRIQTSSDGTSWTTIDTRRDHTAKVTDIDLAPVSARHLRILLDEPGTGSPARVADVEIYGSR